MRRTLQALPAVILVLALIGIWEVYVDLKGPTFSLILPSPHQVAKALYTDRGLLWSSFLVTAQEVLLGILVATVVGCALSVAMVAVGVGGVASATPGGTEVGSEPASQPVEEWTATDVVPQ